MPNFLDEYLVKLGYAQDLVGYRRFEQALRDASGMVEGNARSMVGSMAKVETSLVAGFAAIGVAAIGMIDKVAMADQEYRLFALHMYMSKDAARSLKVAMDALGQPLENLTWDPELRERTRQLIRDQRELAVGVGGDFEANMRKVRDVRFEFTRLEVEMKYLGFALVNDIFKAFGGSDNVLDRLRQLNAWLIKNLPDIAQKISTYVVPVLKDVGMIMSDVWQVTKDFARVFDEIIGLISGDATLRGEVTFDKFARSIEKVVHWIALACDFLLKFAGLLTGTIAGGTVGSTLGAIIGGIAGIPGGPIGVVAGAAGGSLTGGGIGAGTGAVAGGVFDIIRALNFHNSTNDMALLNGMGGPATGNAQISGLIDQAADRFGIDRNLLHAMSGQESGQRQTDANGRTITSSAGALGAMQLMPGTARGLGVDPYDAQQNVMGGAKLLRDLLDRYNGNIAAALAAYNWNPEGVNQTLAGRATLPAETQNYVASIMGKMGQRGDVQIGSVTIHIMQPNASPDQIREATAQGMRDGTQARVQRNLAEFQSLGYSY